MSWKQVILSGMRVMLSWYHNAMPISRNKRSRKIAIDTTIDTYQYLTIETTGGPSLTNNLPAQEKTVALEYLPQNTISHDHFKLKPLIPLHCNQRLQLEMVM
jgi:hypothetical protein